MGIRLRLSTWQCLTEPQRLLALPALALCRFAFLVVDLMAAAFFGTCSRGCGVVPLSGCEGLLGFIAVLNFFSVLALALIVLIRWFTEERAFSEAHYVTSVLVMLDLALKLGDMGTPVMVAGVCFPGSTLPPFNNSMLMANCPKPSCPVGDLFAVYTWYTVPKVVIGAVDVLINTETLVRKPRDWYRLRGTHAR